MLSKKNIAIAFGGISTEHEVSVITGIQVLKNTDRTRFNPIPVYISKTGQWYTGKALFDINTYKDLSSIPFITKEVYLTYTNNHNILKSVKNSIFSKFEQSIDVFFPCFHGGLGESGGFQALLELAHLPYVGSGILGSVVGMDKIMMKEVFKSHSIPVGPFTCFYSNVWEQQKDNIVQEIENSLTYPVFVKPSNSGSSIGVAKAKNREEMMHAIDVAILFDRKVIIEQGIEGCREVNISVIGNSGSELIASEIEEVFAKSDFLNYEDKYKGEGKKSSGMASTKRILPAHLKLETREKIQEVAKKCFVSLDCFGLVRVDFLVNETTGELYVLEINTIPGSMSFYLWEASSITFSQMITKLVDLAEERFRIESQKTTSFTSNILENMEGGIKNSKLG